MIEHGCRRPCPAAAARRTRSPVSAAPEPIVREIALWWVRHFMREAGAFKETTLRARSVEALPLPAARERASGVHITYELRLTGKGGGVWVDRHRRR